MIGKKNKNRVILAILLIILFINVGSESCIGDTYDINKSGNEKVSGRVICIDENIITLAVGNECDLEVIEENSEDALTDDNINSNEDKRIFELTGQEKTVQIEENSKISIENEYKIVAAKLNDIDIGSILCVEYNELNNIVSVVIKDSDEYLNDY